MLLDGGRHLRRLAVVLRVVAPHEPLQLGEFTDHVGDEIRLGEQRGAVGEHGIGADHRRDGGGQRAQARHAIGLPAQLVVMDHAAELLDARLEPLPAILVEEELGVGQPRTARALSLPPMITTGSSVAMLLTSRKRLTSFRLLSASAK